MKLKELAARIGGTLTGDGEIEVVRPVHPSDAVGQTDLAMAMQPDLLALLPASKARAAVVAAGADVPPGAVDGYIEVGRPRYAMAHVNNAFQPPPWVEPGVHPSAVVEPGAEIGAGAAIGPFVYVGRGARIGPGCVLYPHVSVGPGAVIGGDSILHAGVRVGAGCRLGQRVIVHHNASIGADGFSFVTPERGSVESARSSGRVEEAALNRQIVRIASLGTVEIGDDVEIGALTAIDRGTLTPTRIGDHTKIDDLVMIGHNVVVGRNCMLCGQVGVAGSTVIGDRVVLAGQVGVADHIRIGDDVVVGASAGVGTDLAPRAVYGGNPAVPHRDYISQVRGVRKLRQLLMDMAEVKRRLGLGTTEG
ncbi:MAG TPA: UDP-3-O-(3-hydroxymyristoyl)glucosamine N-acyltransferase [Azospirillaceae bacterium]|nr:UDP-3-O-(3-hydroxymyristoyl)glucosamine N-acyltransferase [Azospirillaceae bacterium]